MAYLPKERMLIEADLFDRAEGGEVVSSPEMHQALRRNVEQLGLEVETIVPIHGRPTRWSELP